jgi:hypothetical protein
MVSSLMDSAPLRWFAQAWSTGWSALAMTALGLAPGGHFSGLTLNAGAEQVCIHSAECNIDVAAQSIHVEDGCSI